MRIVAPIKTNPASRVKFAEKRNLFSAVIYPLYDKKLSNLRPLLTITFPQGFKKSKRFGHWTWAKRAFNGVRKCDGKTNTQTNTPIDIKLIEKIGPKGRFFEEETRP